MSFSEVDALTRQIGQPARRDTAFPPGLLTDKAYRLIEEKLVTLAFPPDAALDEDMIGAEIGIDTLSVRGALRRLAREGLVEVRFDGRMVVSEINTQSQLQLLEVRRMLEGLTAALAAERATLDQRERFRAIDRSLREVASHADEIIFMRLDGALHKLLPEAAQNPFCGTMLETISGLARRYFFRHKAALDLGQTARLHADISLAVADGDAQAAVAAVNALLDYNQRFALERLVAA